MYSSKRQRRALMCLGLLGVLAHVSCREPPLVAALPPGARVDTYTQQAVSKIDVLWIIDNSGSMAPRQENLAQNFKAFFNEFAKNAIDFRIAVTTTDIFVEGGAFVGQPAVLTPQTSNLIHRFAENVKVGTEGSPYEVGMEAAHMAIEKQKAKNKESVEKCQSRCSTQNNTCRANCAYKADFPFLRTDAYLYLIFVTDEDDKSQRDILYFYRYFETVRGVGNDSTVIIAAIAGDVPSNSCEAVPGERYKKLSLWTGGVFGSICDENFSNTLRKLATNAVGLKRKFALQEKPNRETLEVRLRYPCDIAQEFRTPCIEIDVSQCAGKPASSMNLLCKPKWMYEEANNVVYFAGESVPALGGRIELQYYTAGNSP